MNWIWLHIPFLVISYALFLGAAGACVLFLIQERRIKRHEALAVSSRMPSLEALDRFVFTMIFYSFPLLTIGLLLGGHGALLKRHHPWSLEPAETLSFLTWLLYAIYLSVRGGFAWRGRRSTYLALIGFFIILVTVIALSFFSPLHGTRSVM